MNSCKYSSIQKVEVRKQERQKERDKEGRPMAARKR
jgi:hypothetical protein